MNIAILTVSSLALVCSATTLVVVLVGANKVKREMDIATTEIDVARNKANRVVQTLTDALNDFTI